MIISFCISTHMDTTDKLVILEIQQFLIIFILIVELLHPIVLIILPRHGIYESIPNASQNEEQSRNDSKC